MFEESHELLHVDSDKLHAVCASNTGESCCLLRIIYNLAHLVPVESLQHTPDILDM